MSRAMKASELRISNWVNYHGLPYQVQEIELRHGVYECNGDLLESDIFEPIPITEEWLLKFGFEEILVPAENDNEDDFSYYELNDISFMFYNESNTILVTIGSYSEVEYNNYYVHQLQNLYFALTGEELEIKE